MLNVVFIAGHKIKALRSVALILVIIVQCGCDVFSSIRLVQKAATQEVKMIDTLQAFVSRESDAKRHVQADIKSFLKKVKEIHRDVKCISDFAENPVNAFRLLYRFALEWPKVFRLVHCDGCIMYDSIRKFNESISQALNYLQPPPSIRDLKGGAAALLRLSETYKLDVAKLINGTILSEQATPLSFDEIMVIGKCAEELENYYDQVVWLSELLKSRELTEDNIKEVKRSIAAGYSNFGMPWKSLEILSDYAEDGDDTGVLSDYQSYKLKLDGLQNYQKYKAFSPPFEYNKNMYHSLCRGTVKAEEEQSTLKCFLRPTKNPFIFGKEEVMHYTPRVSLFHDVITDAEAAYIRSNGERVLERSLVDQLNPGASDAHRVSQTGWLKDDEHPYLTPLTERVGLFTGLDTTYRNSLSSVERYQALNYGVGGMYNPHHDNLPTPLWGPPSVTESLDIVGTGDRIATWMFYIYDVKAGGATVFPKLKTRIPAVKGAAAFWYNVLPNGKQDDRMLHAGCPVLLGSKWVANKWIRQHGQVLTKKCELNEHADFTISPVFSGS